MTIPTASIPTVEFSTVQSELSSIIYVKAAPKVIHQIMERKFEDEQVSAGGLFFYGYKSAACHPLSVVQKFVLRARGSLALVIVATPTPRHYETGPLATQMSSNNLHWQPLPEGIRVAGMYGFVCRNMRRVEEDEGGRINLANYMVAAGTSSGKLMSQYMYKPDGDGYLPGRPFFACATRLTQGATRTEDAPFTEQVLYIAEIVAPHAVFLR